MESQELVELMKFKFKSDIVRTHVRFKNRIHAEVKREVLFALASWLFKDNGLRFIIASASDLGHCFEIFYHFSHDKTGLVLNLQVFLPYDKPETESLVPLFVAADWIEREMHELFGIRFKNHPHLAPLLSNGNWKSDNFPYAHKH